MSDTGVFRQKIRAYFKGLGGFKGKLENTTSILPISVGQPYHEGEKFAATIELINQTGFKKCVVVVCDSLQRHTIRIMHPDKSEQEALELSLLRGKEWVERNRSSLEKLSVPYKLTHWDEWRLSTSFIEKENELKKIYHNSIQFQESVNYAVDSFLKRAQNKNPDILPLHRESSSKKSVAYILEECTMDFFWLSEKYNFELYPHRKPRVKKIIYKQLQFPCYTSLLKRVIVEFQDAF